MLDNNQSLLAKTLQRNPPTVVPETLLVEAIALMTQQQSNYVLVLEAQKLRGIFTERDLVKITAQKRSLVGVTMAAVMSRQLITLPFTKVNDIWAVLSCLRENGIRHLPIVDEEGSLMGMVTPEMIRQMLRPTDLLKLRRVAEVMTTKVVQANPTASVLQIAQLMAEHRVSCVVITQTYEGGETRPVGIITERDLVQFCILELNLEQTRAETIMSRPLSPIKPQDSLWASHQKMQNYRLCRLVVVNEEGILVGLVTQTSILQVLEPVEMYSMIEALQEVIQEQTTTLAQTNQKLEREIVIRQQQEEELSRAKETAEAANQAKSTFIAHMSHELRTPLASILNHLKLLEEGFYENEEELAEYIQTASLSAKTLDRIVDSILDLAKIEAGKMQVELEIVELEPLFEELSNLFQPDTLYKDIKLIINCQVARVYADRIKLKQVLTNLLNNAFKFTPQGEIHFQARAKIESTASGQKTIVEISVVDTGIGIELDKQASIFEAFVQEDGSIHRRYGGTGLGLRICKQLVELMGGQISLFSAGRERGTTVRITLPGVPV